MPPRLVLLTLLCLLIFSGRGAHASTREGAPPGKDLKRVEAVLSKLRRLAEASADPEAFGRTARKLYPGLFASVSKLSDGDLKTDLETSVAFYESALRAGVKGAAPDCSRELRETYLRLCLEARGDRARLLRAKALLHARRAEAQLLYARGERGAATLEAMSVVRAERATDRALADEALGELKELAAELEAGAASAAHEGPRELTGARPGRRTEAVAARLEQLDRLLASLPRERASRLLRDSRDAFRDGLYWRLKAAPALALVVDANSFAAHGTLPRIGLGADDAGRAALANLRAGLKFIRRAEEELGR